MIRQRSGFTITELMIALVVFGIVGLAVSRFVINSQRISRTQLEMASMQSNLRTGALVVPSELRELAADGTASDIIAMSSTSMTFRAMRGLGFTCSVTATQIKVLDTGAVPFYGARDPLAGRDRIALFVENNPNFPTDDDWIMVTPTGVDLSNDCGGRAAIMFTVPNITGLLTTGIDDVVVGGPLRTFEVVELGPVTVSGQTWLGSRSVSAGDASLTPVLGPLESAGFGLEYRDAAGAVTGVMPNVRQIRVSLRGSTEQAVSSGMGDSPSMGQDTLITAVTLRNGG